MSRIFGALANAASKYGEGRFKRQVYDNQQAQQELENNRRAFEYAASQGLQREQMQLLKQQRDDQLQRQREADVVSAQQHGYEDAPIEAVGSGVNAFLQSQGMGGPASAGVVRAPNSAIETHQFEGQTFGDARPDAKPRNMQYATVGGRTMRYDPQRAVNDQTRQAFEKFSQDVYTKRDLAQQNQAQRDEAARERADAANETRVMVAQIAASARQNANAQGGAVQRPTEAQEKSFLYSKLMQQGNSIMQAEEGKISPERISAYLSARWSKPALTPAEQRFLVGARTYAAGVYRKESGAAVKDDEIRETFARYIPGFFDDPTTRTLKADQRKQYEETMQQLATPAARFYQQFGGAAAPHSGPATGTQAPAPATRKPSGAVPWETKKP